MQAYDQHLNMVLGDVEESVTLVEIDDETYEEIVRVSKQRKHVTDENLFFPFAICNSVGHLVARLRAQCVVKALASRTIL